MKEIKVTLRCVEKEFTKDSKVIKYLEYYLVFPSGESVSVSPKDWDKKLMKILVSYNAE